MISSHTKVILLLLYIAVALPGQPSVDNSSTTAITRAIEKVGPAVACINVQQNVSAYSTSDPFFRYFFPPEIYPMKSSGSGVVISPDGYVLPNTHVVENAGLQYEHAKLQVLSNDISKVLRCKNKNQNTTKIKVALIYKKSYNYFQPDHFDQTSYDFFFKALKRNIQLEISYYPCEKKFDVSKIKGKCDVILLPNNSTDGSPDVLIGIKNSNIPVISRTGDPHDAERYNQIEFCEKNNI